MFTIAFGHSIDSVLYVLGDFTSYSTILANRRPQTKIIDRKTDTVVDTVTKDTPDQVLVQGTLTSGAVLSAHYRGGKPFASPPQALWRIYGEKGEIEVTAPSPLYNVVTPALVKILLHDQAQGEVEEIKIEKDAFDAEFGDLPGPAQNIGRLYEAYRKGENTVVWFEEAVARHDMLADMYTAWDGGEQGRTASFVQKKG